ncbi:MAG TPA: DUF6036 family nucleotidyltransferase [Cytophagaceae bacterium]|jgi:hypothetical protein|nr:DUF6036 family nucleotidyltransferase [Cytophagaceae bacterium]
MDIFDEEILKLWKSFSFNGLEYIMVGGVATNLHGYSRTTADIDIWIKDTIENRKRLNQSLIQFGYGEIPNIETLEFVPGWTSLRLMSGIELDIMTSLKGFPQERFDECMKYASTAIIFTIEVKFLHINHLIEAKKTSNRNKDIIDIEELEKIKKEKESE